MHLPISVRDRSFYANFYSRHPAEIEIIDLNPSSSSSCALRTLSESPTSITPLSDGISSVTSGFFSSSDCSSSESTGSFTKRRRPTAPTIQERLNTYESACQRPSLPLPSLILSKQKAQSSSALSPSSLVNQRIPRQISTEQIKPLLINTSNLIDNDTSKTMLMAQDDSSINEKSIALDSSKRYLSKSTSQLCEQSSIDHHKQNDEEDEERKKLLPLSSRNILDVIQEELSEIRRADHDLKSMFISIYGKIQNIQQMKSSTTSLHHQYQKGHRYHYHHNDRSSRTLAHCCYSSNSDIRRINCTHHHHHHHNRKYTLHSVAALRNRMNTLRTSSIADNDSYVDTDSSYSESDSGTCSSPVENVPCIED